MVRVPRVVGVSTPNPDFQGTNLGTFVVGSVPLTLNGGQIKTWKNGSSDVWGGNLNYRLYPAGSPDGSFTAVPLPFDANLPNPGDQQWTNTAANVDLLSGLTEGSYTLEIYFDSPTNEGTNYNNNGDANYTATFTVATAVTLTDARALWLDAATIAWNGATGSSYRLLYDPDGELVPAVAAATPCAFPLTGSCAITLTASGTISGYPKNPNANGLTRLTNLLTADQVKEVLQGQTAVASYDSGGNIIQISGAQIQSVLDDLYVDNVVGNGTAEDATLGVTYSGGSPSVHVWAPTAQSVTLRRYADAATASYTSHALTRDDASGVWSVTGAADWDRDFYLFDVAVYVPSQDAIVHNLVTDPYAVSLSTDSLLNIDRTDPNPNCGQKEEADTN